MGPHSALAGYGNLCAHPLVMLTIITAQNGAQVKQNTRIAVAGCGIRIVRRRVAAHRLILTLETPAAGSVIVTGRGLKSTSRSVRRAGTTTLKIPLSGAGRRALRSHHPLKVRVRVRFVPKQKGEAASSASTTVSFRR